LLKVVLPLSLAFIMFTLGMGLKVASFSDIARFPKAFTLGLINQVILLPLVGFSIAVLFQLPPALAVGVMILALSPGGVTTNVLTKIAGANTALSITLTAIVTLISVVTLPIIINLSMRYFTGSVAEEFNIFRISLSIFLITVVPVSIGVLLTHLTPRFVAKASRLLSKVAMALFVIIVFAAILSNWDTLVSNLIRLGPALILMNVVLLVVGLLTASIVGLGAKDATTISIETGVQNVTIAIAVAPLIVASTTVLPEEAIPAAVYGVVMYLVTLPFVFLRMRKHKTSD
jgi:BASS family bile acid:Na+ symporter